MKFSRFRRIAAAVLALWCAAVASKARDEAEEDRPKLAELQAKAERGEVQAMVDVGQRYDWGSDGEMAQDFAQALGWYEKTAAEGSTAAKKAYRTLIDIDGENGTYGSFGKTRLDELGAPASGWSADQLLRSAEGMGLARAEADVQKLLNQAVVVAETGSPETRYRLAVILMQGTFGVGKDEARAKRLLKSAAEDGFASAKLDYASTLMQGALGFTAEPERGRTMLNEVMADAERANPDAQHQIGMLLYQGTVVPVDKARGIKLVNTAADWGVGPAQFEIGRALMTGLPELPADFARGVGYLKGYRLLLRQLDGALGWVGVLTVEERGVADGTDAYATTFVGDLVAEGGAFVAIESEEAEFDQLVGAEEFLKFVEKGGCEAAFAEFQRGLEGLADAAEMGFLRAGERKVVHGKRG